ncbi:hypothetical protein O3651_07985 [Streptococcus sp. 27098_8_73]|uniref:hypothetical protein n=1 Tax=Streptococcus sp. 27098_8_73 TaxID=3003668 RepID=UPI00352D223C
MAAFGLGTIISAILLFAQEGKKNSVTNITSERSQWRKKIENLLLEVSDLIIQIKSIPENLKLKDIKFYDIDLKDYRETIIEKTRDLITAFGIIDIGKKTNRPIDYYLNNVHIWNLLKTIEFEDISNEDNILKLELLREYLRFLKKRDWEFSKYEVKYGIARTIFIIIRIILGISIILTFGVYYFSNENKISSCRLFIETLFVLLALFFCFACGVFIDNRINKKLNQQIIDNVSPNKMKKNYLKRVIAKYRVKFPLIFQVTMLNWILLMLSIIFCILVFFIGRQLVKNIYNLSIIALCLSSIFYLSLVWIQTKIYKNEVIYISKLRELESLPQYRHILQSYIKQEIKEQTHV